MAQVKSLIKEVFENLGKNTKVKGVFVNPTLRGKGVKEEEIRWAGLEIDPQKAYSKEELLEIESRRKDRMRVLETDAYSDVSLHTTLESSDNYNARVYQFKEADSGSEPRYRSDHFGNRVSANYLMHARTFDTLSPDLNDSRVLQEIQSDLHQEAAMSGGYRGPDTLSVTRKYMNMLEEGKKWIDDFNSKSESEKDWDEFHDVMEGMETALGLRTEGSVEVEDKINELWKMVNDGELQTEILDEEKLIEKILDIEMRHDITLSGDPVDVLDEFYRDGVYKDIPVGTPEGDQFEKALKDYADYESRITMHPPGIQRHTNSMLPPQTPFKNSWAQKTIEQEYVKALNDGMGELVVPIKGPKDIMDRLVRGESVQTWYEEVVPKIMKRIANNPNARSDFKMEYRDIDSSYKFPIGPAVASSVNKVEKSIRELSQAGMGDPLNPHAGVPQNMDQENLMTKFQSEMWDLENDLFNGNYLAIPKVQEALEGFKNYTSSFEYLISTINDSAKVPRSVRRRIKHLRRRMERDADEGRSNRTYPIQKDRIHYELRTAGVEITSEVQRAMDKLAKNPSMKDIDNFVRIAGEAAERSQQIQYAVLKPKPRDLTKAQKEQHWMGGMGRMTQHMMKDKNMNPVMQAQKFMQMYEKEFGKKYNDVYDFLRDLNRADPPDYKGDTDDIKFYLYSSPFAAIWSAYYAIQAGKDPSKEIEKAGLDKPMAEEIERQARSIIELRKSGMTLEEIKEHMEAQYGAEL